MVLIVHVGSLLHFVNIKTLKSNLKDLGRECKTESRPNVVPPRQGEPRHEGVQETGKIED